MGNSKTPHKPSTCASINDVTFGDIIKDSSHQFDFGDNINGTPNDYPTRKDYHSNADVDTSMILTNLSKRDKIYPTDISNVISSTNPSSTQEMKELMIDGKLYLQVNTSFIYLYTHNHTHCQSLVKNGDNAGVYGKDINVINTPPNWNVNN